MFYGFNVNRGAVVAIFVTGIGLSIAVTAEAAVTWTGDIDPVDPTTWTTGTLGFVGKTGDGTLDINAGSIVRSTSGFVGLSSGVTGTVTIDQANSAWVNSDVLSVGVSGDGSLILSNGAMASSVNWVIASESGSTGQVAVSGMGSILTSSINLFVGDSGEGTMTVSGGPSIYSYNGIIGRNEGGNGTVTINGPGSNWSSNGTLTIGDAGTGTLLISDGATVSGGIRNGVTIGNTTTGHGTITVEGAGSILTSGSELVVGDFGNGTLTIASGGQVSNAANYDCTIGDNAGSQGAVAVDGAGSSLTIGQDLSIGQAGNGRLGITGGGNVADRNGYLGYNAGSTGTATVDGAGSAWTSSEVLVVGYSGAGSLNIANGGSVTAGKEVWIAREPGSTGTIDFDNGTLNTALLLASPDSLSGTGVINTHGLISDLNLTFDATHGTTQTLMLNDTPTQNITLHLDADGSAAMGAGYRNSGTMLITDGQVVSSTEGHIAMQAGSTGTVTVDGPGSLWTTDGLFVVGERGNGILYVTNGGSVKNHVGQIGQYPGSTGRVFVDGESSVYYSEWSLKVGGPFGHGELTVTNGGTVTSDDGWIGMGPLGGTGEVIVDGRGSTWEMQSSFYVNGILRLTRGGRISSGWCTSGFNEAADILVDGLGTVFTTNNLNHYNGAINITHGGLVKVANAMKIDDRGQINMATGGMLALYGEADDSLAQFFDQIEGTDAINYWDDSAGDWAPLSGAIPGVDYTLQYITDGGDLDGYTLLTVGVIPEPATLALMALGVVTGGVAGLRSYRGSAPCASMDR